MELHLRAIATRHERRQGFVQLAGQLHVAQRQQVAALCRRQARQQCRRPVVLVAEHVARGQLVLVALRSRKILVSMNTWTPYRHTGDGRRAAKLT